MAQSGVSSHETIGEEDPDTWCSAFLRKKLYGCQSLYRSCDPCRKVIGVVALLKDELSCTVRVYTWSKNFSVNLHWSKSFEVLLDQSLVPPDMDQGLSDRIDAVSKLWHPGRINWFVDHIHFNITAQSVVLSNSRRPGLEGVFDPQFRLPFLCCF